MILMSQNGLVYEEHEILQGTVPYFGMARNAFSSPVLLLNIDAQGGRYHVGKDQMFSLIHLLSWHTVFP